MFVVDSVLGRYIMESRLLPVQLAPPLHHADWSKGTAELVQFGAGVVAQVVGMVVEFTTIPGCLL